MNPENFPFTRTFLFVLLAAAFLSIIPGCSAPIELASTPPRQSITIDGNSTDWSDALTYLEKEDVSLGVHDDGQFLSICLVTANRTYQMQILGGDFTVWFDTKGGKESRCGIRFPVKQSGPLPIPRGSVPLTDVVAAFASRFQDAQILGASDGETQTLSVLQIPGVAVRIGASGSALVYELQVPLEPVKGCPLDLHGARGGKLGIGFEAVALGSDQLAGPSGQSTSMPGRRGGGSRSASASVNDSQREDALDFWTLVQLTHVAS